MTSDTARITFSEAEHRRVRAQLKKEDPIQKPEYKIPTPTARRQKAGKIATRNLGRTIKKKKRSH
jgi:hypothetical protein